MLVSLAFHLESVLISIEGSTVSFSDKTLGAERSFEIFITHLNINHSCAGDAISL